MDRDLMPALLALSLVAIPAGPVDAAAHPRQDDVRFEHLSIEQGLSNSTVRSIAQDSLGFIWVGTEDGLNRYDGYSFTVYKHDPLDSGSISSNEIIALCVDAQGNLWAAGGWGGLDRYDRANDRFIHHTRRDGGSTGLLSDRITALAVDRNGILWIGSDSGLTRYDRNEATFHHLRRDPGVSNRMNEGTISCILPDPTGPLWIGFGLGGIQRWGGLTDPPGGSLTVRTYRHDPADQHSLSDDNITSIGRDAEGRLWIGTFGNGLNLFDPSTERFISSRSGDSLIPADAPRSVTSVCAGTKGDVWIGYFSDGLGRYDRPLRGHTRHRADLYDPDALTSDRVYALLEDRTGSIWIGTHRGGLHRYDPRSKRFRHVQHRPDDETSLSAGTVSAIREDSEGNLWIGVEDGGMDHYERSTGRYTHHRHDPANRSSIGSDQVMAILEDSHGRIWVRTAYGLDEFDRRSRRFTHHRVGSPFGESRGLCEDRHGNLWMGTVMGSRNVLTRLNPMTMTFEQFPELGTASEIQFIFEDNADALWVGTFGQGLYRFSTGGKGPVQYIPDPSDQTTIGSSSLYSIARDRGGTIWIGHSGGLDRYDRDTDTFEHFTERDGLANNSVKAIVADNDGALWLSTMRGLSRFDPASRRFRNYGLGDGVQANEFRTGSSFRSRDGSIYFGGVKGYNVFHPDSIRENPVPPPVVLTRFKVFDAPFELPEAIATIRNIEISYAQDVFSFEFVGLNFTNSSRNQYAYRMEGFDREWVYSGTRRYASYTHLDPGEYVFRVKASNNDGLWNETGASVSLTVIPPFWMTWWFRVSAMVVVLGALAWSIRRVEQRKVRERLQQLERESALERERTRIARDMHDDLGARLTEIGLLSELTRRDLTDARATTSNLRAISESAREIVESFQEIVWSINPRNDTLENVAEYLTQYASGYIRKAGLRTRFDIPAGMPDLKVSSDIRHNLIMVVKEALTNTVKHAGASEVSLTIVCHDHRLQIDIKDDGRGFAADGVGRFGNGLANIRRRMESIAAGVEIQTAPGAGTTVSLSIPLHKSGA